MTSRSSLASKVQESKWKSEPLSIIIYSHVSLLPSVQTPGSLRVCWGAWTPDAGCHTLPGCCCHLMPRASFYQYHWTKTKGRGRQRFKKQNNKKTRWPTAAVWERETIWKLRHIWHFLFILVNYETIFFSATCRTTLTCFYLCIIYINSYLYPQVLSGQ